MNMEIIKQLAILIVGFALLVKGADLFVDGASGIASGGLYCSGSQRKRRHLHR